MPAVPLKEGMNARDFRTAAKAAEDAGQARRLLALAAIRDGQSREAAARIGGMDRQTLRDWVHAVNERGIDGLVNATSPGRPPKLPAGHKAEIKALVETGPDMAAGGVDTLPEARSVGPPSIRRPSSNGPPMSGRCSSLPAVWS